MEKVILTTSQLNQLARHHPTLAPHYYGAVPCDGLPEHPMELQQPKGYIVNTDPTGEPGQHWIGAWTDGNTCEVFDSFALDLPLYQTAQPFQDWLNRHFKYITHNGQSVQSLHNQSCGEHALMFLVTKSQGKTMSELSRLGQNTITWPTKSKRVLGLAGRDVISGKKNFYNSLNKRRFLFRKDVEVDFSLGKHDNMQ